MAGIWFPSLLLLLSVAQPAYFYSLRPGGRNVITTYKHYYDQVGTSIKVATYRRTCSKTCVVRFMFWCTKKKWTCRRITNYKWIPSYRQVLRRKSEYSCSSGWLPNGSECTKPYCAGGCRNGGICTSPYYCRCAPGWTGSYSRCRQDVDECQYRYKNSCSYKPGCVNTPGSYRCDCRTGYYLMPDQRSCGDTDECTLEQDDCGTNTYCINTQGSYTCECNNGFTRSSRRTCTDIVECDSSSGVIHGCQGTCVNLPGSYQCSCSKGYYLAYNRKDCLDVDECSSNNHGCKQGCQNYHGGYTCTCSSGFRLNSVDHNSCDDVDECSEKTAGCAQKCNNEIGSFLCSCNKGYRLKPDLKSCEDIDECSLGLHHCQHNCKNTPGSYKCNCRPGFDLLPNGENCAGRPCLPLYSPMNGAKNCSGYTTEEVCHFQCSPGYHLIGSRKRTCTPMKRWSGMQTKCKIIFCSTPVEPWNGFVYSPCKTHFDSQCSVGCERGYYIQGSQKITCDANGAWQPKNITCIEMKACHPNPCLHGGICFSTASTQYSCDCSSTGYIGVKCDVGHINIPDYPTLTPGSPSHPLTFQASPPSDYIVLTLINRNLKIDPSRLVFKHGTSTTQSLTFTARKPGLHFIQYLLSGPSAVEFQPPPENAIFAKSSADSSSDNEPLFTDFNTLPSGCHRQQLNKCPHTDDVIYAASTSPWFAVGPLAMTRGVVNVEFGVNNVPLSLFGASLPHSDLVSVPEHCSEEEEDVKYSPEQLLRLRVLEQSFLDAVRESLPKWLLITLRKDSSSKTISTSQFQTRYLTGERLVEAGIGEGQPISEETYFSLLLSKNLNLTIQNDVDIFKSRSHQSPVSLAVDLCGSSPNNVIIHPSLRDMDLVNNLLFVKYLKENGWNFKFYSLQISKKRLIQKLKKGPFWNGKRFFEISSSANGNMAMVSSFNKFFEKTSFVNCGVEFDGTIIADVDDIDNILDSPLRQEWKVDLYGKITLITTFQIQDKTTKLILKSPQSIGYAKFGGIIPKRCVTHSNCDPHGFFFTNVLEQDPFIYSELNQFAEMGSNKTLSCFLDTMIYSDKKNNKSTYSEINDGISMAFNGILKFGPLRFHNLHIQLSVRSCDCSNPKTQETNSFKNTGIEFTANYNQLQRQKLGIFERTPGMPPNIRLHIARKKNSTSTGSFQSVAKFFGFEKLVNVSFSYQGLSFLVSGKIHGLFNASMNCSSNLNSWENQIFVVTGEFEDKSSAGNLKDILGDEINKYAVHVVNRAKRREKSVKETEKQIKTRLENVLLFKKKTSGKVKEIKEQHLIAERELELAKKELTYFEQASNNYSKDVDEMKSELDGICLVKQCPDICQEGEVCNKCYRDVIVNINGVCPGTCFKTKQQRLRPYNEIVLCDRKKCKRVHSTKGFFALLFGDFFGGLVKSVLSSAITAVGSFFGVPPPVSAAIGSGLVTLVDTGRVDETMCATSRGFLTGFIGGPTVSNFAKAGIGKSASALVKKSISCQRDQRDGYWKCHVEKVKCTKDRFQYKYEPIYYTCEKPCKLYKVKKTTEKPCCSTASCAFFVVNLTCVAENALCKKTRKIALDGMSKTKANGAKILASLEHARKNVSYWKIKKKKEYIKLMSTLRSLNTFQSAVRSLEKAYNVTVEARERKLELLAKPLKLRALMDERLESVVMVKLERIRFNAKVSAGLENTLFPIDIVFQLNGSRELELSTVLDFRKLNQSLRSIAKEILSHFVGDLSSVSRKKRSVEDIRSSVSDPKLSALKDYHRLCSEVTNYEQTLQDVVRSLYNLSSEVCSLRKNSRNEGESPFNTSIVLTQFTVNETMASKLGINISNALYSDYLEADPEMTEGKNLQQEAIRNGYEPLEQNSKLLVYNWFATMEDIFNDSAIAYKCSGLNDCLTFILDSLFDIYSVIDLPWAQKIREHIRGVETKLSELMQRVDISVEDAAESSLEILKILKDMTTVNKICESAPNITKHPEAFTEMGVGETLFLSCNASGSSLVYNWRFNDEILQDHATNVLLIKNITVSHSGNYTCEVLNYVAKEASIAAVVVIHPPPLITVQPVNYLSVVISNDDSLGCEAESSDRNISYQWWYRSVDSASFYPLINETFPYLNFAPMKAHHEGWYFCNVSNSYDFSISTISFVKTLYFTLPVPAATLSLYVVKRALQNSTLVNDSNVNRYEDISFQILNLLSSFENFDTDSIERRIRNLNPVSCQFRVSQDNKTDVDVKVCRWKFNYLGKNTTSNSSINDGFETNIRKVINASLDVKQAINELVNATNNGSLDKQAYFVEMNSLAVQEFSLLCLQSDTLIQEDFHCVDRSCPPGFSGKLDENMISSCFPCSLGSYQPNSGQTSCVKCPEGFTTTSEGSYKKSQCKEFPNEVGRSSIGVGSNMTQALCKNDLLLIVDTSYSVGEFFFKKQVKSFLQDLVTDKTLNVGPNGTRVSMIVFSDYSNPSSRTYRRSRDKTKVLIPFHTNYASAKTLNRTISRIRWDDVKGGLTRTDVALRIANTEIFPLKSPQNNRKSADDVILLITDGEPRGSRNTVPRTIAYAEKLKKKGVYIIGVGYKIRKPEFWKILTDIVTTGQALRAFDNFKWMKKVLPKKLCQKEGALCRDRAFNINEQDCCCGAIYNRKPNFKCCAQDYCDTSKLHCCDDSDKGCPNQ